MNLVTDSLEKVAGFVALTIVSMVPPLQVTEPQLWNLLVASPPYVFLFVALILLRRREVIWRTELDERLTAAKTLFDTIVAEHVQALAQIEKERERERAQFQARLDATTAHYEARLRDKDHLNSELFKGLRESTVTLATAAALVTNQQKTPAA
jgi:hypothetical protein